VRSDIKHLRREQLIDATIDTIARYGFRKTTLSQVAKQAKLSQGIVNFYFKSKDGLLLETLRFLAEEYEVSWKRAVVASGPDPVAALNAIIETDLGRKVCNRRKVSVWVAFWGESQSQPQFRKLCSKLSEDYLAQTREIISRILDRGGYHQLDSDAMLISRILDRGGYHQLDSDAIASGLNAMINGLWLDLMIDPKHFDREAAKRACRNYLASVFPAEFAAIGPPVAPSRRAG
jgi:TetR/AcrR family transcriptional repressor of bet genes